MQGAVRELPMQASGGEGLLDTPIEMAQPAISEHNKRTNAFNVLDEPHAGVQGVRVGEDVAALTPHSPGRAQLRHPVLHGYRFAYLKCSDE